MRQTDGSVAQVFRGAQKSTKWRGMANEETIGQGRIREGGATKAWMKYGCVYHDVTPPVLREELEFRKIQKFSTNGRYDITVT